MVPPLQPATRGKAERRSFSILSRAGSRRSIREQGGGVSVRKDSTGYTLVRDDTGLPIARLRPKDAKGNFEVFYWNLYSNRWRKVGDFGGTILPLDDALEFIAEDPMDCFWR